jgi:chemotaxis protein MotB
MATQAKVIIITKKAKGHGHHGGAWKVAYADFVTAMMALFIMLWILSQTDKETRQQLSEYFRTGVFSGAPSAMQGGSGLLEKGYLDTVGDAKELELESLDVTARAVKQVLNAQAAVNTELAELMKDVTVQITSEGLLIQIVDTKGSMLFDVSSAELKPPLVNLLKVLGPILGRAGNRIQIHGHTDGRKFPPGSPNTNWSLSFERADRARSILEPMLNPQQILGVYAHGEAMPNDPDPLAPKNRRLAILAMSNPAKADANENSEARAPADAASAGASPLASASAAPRGSVRAAPSSQSSGAAGSQAPPQPLPPASARP